MQRVVDHAHHHPRHRLVASGHRALGPVPVDHRSEHTRDNRHL